MCDKVDILELERLTRKGYKAFHRFRSEIKGLMEYKGRAPYGRVD